MSVPSKKLPGRVAKVIMGYEEEDSLQDALRAFKLDSSSTLEDDKTLLFYACEFGTSQSVKSLLMLDADRSHRDKSGRTPVHGAAERGRTDILQLLMENGPSVANISDNEGCTPLHLAAKEGITETVRFLLDQKVDMNLRDEAGRTPLKRAVVNCHVQVCELLLRAGAHCPSPQITGNAEILVLLKYYAAKATWLRAYLVDSMMHYTQIRKCETVLVLQEGLVTEELFANLTTAQFHKNYLNCVGILGIGVEQLLLRLHLRLHQKHRRLAEEATAAAAFAPTNA